MVSSDFRNARALSPLATGLKMTHAYTGELSAAKGTSPEESEKRNGARGYEHAPRGATNSKFTCRLFAPVRRNVAATRSLLAKSFVIVEVEVTVQLHVPCHAGADEIVDI